MLSKAHHVVAAKAALLVLGVCLAYWPSMPGGFIFDDDLYLTKAPHIQAADGLYRIWCTSEAMDYYPVTNTSLWLEWRLWGMNPGGYHAVNLALHIAACLLIWLLLHQLFIPGAFFAALLFAIHPVNVETVAWIAQRKNLLALVFFLLSILAYLRADENRQLREEMEGPQSDRQHLASIGPWYWLSLLAFLLAILSKGSAVVLPEVLLLIMWWQRGRIAKTDVLGILPFFLLARVMTPVVSWFVTHAGTDVRAASILERFAGAGSVVWFYLSKALLPIHLLFVYPQWRIETDELRWWLPLAAAVVVTFALWGWHGPRALWRHALLFAWLFFYVALVPVAGLTDTGYMQYSLVADHYQYTALIAVAAFVAAALTAWHEVARGTARFAAAVVITTVTVLLTFMTFEHSRVYGSPIDLYLATLKENPDCGMVHNNLGALLAESRRLPEAIEHYRAAIRLNPGHAEAHANLAMALASAGRRDDAIEEYQQALQLNPDLLAAQNNLGNVLARAGRLEEALPHLEAAVRLKPDAANIRINLGVTLADLARFPEAIEQFQQAIQLDATYAAAYFNLAKASAKMNREAEAIAAAEQGLNLARSTGNSALIRQIENWLKNYRHSVSNSTDESVRPKSSPATP